MRTFLLAFIALILLGNAGGAENLTRRAFTEAVAKAARTAMPSAKVSVAGDLQLEIEYGVGGGTATLSLANAYDLYFSNPQNLKQDQNLGRRHLATSASHDDQPGRSLTHCSQWLRTANGSITRSTSTERMAKSCNIRKGRSRANSSWSTLKILQQPCGFCRQATMSVIIVSSMS